MQGFPAADEPSRAAWQKLQRELDDEVAKDIERLLVGARRHKDLRIRAIAPHGGGPGFFDVGSVRHDHSKKRDIFTSIYTFIYRAGAEDFIRRATARLDRYEAAA